MHPMAPSAWPPRSTPSRHASSARTRLDSLSLRRLLLLGLFRLDGVKQFISNGSIADLYTILAKAPDGPTFFVVERQTPGLTPGRHEIKHGIRLSDTAQVVLEDVLVPAANLVGTGEGDELAV